METLRTKHSEELQRAAQIAQSLHVAEAQLAVSTSLAGKGHVTSIASASAVEATEDPSRQVAMLQAQIVSLEMKIVEEQQRVVTVSDELTKGAEVREPLHITPTTLQLSHMLAMFDVHVNRRRNCKASLRWKRA